MRIDAHQHFWIYDPIKDSWIDETMAKIQRDFLPQDLAPILEENDFEGCIAIQADQTETQNKFLIDLAAKNNFIKGIVGWVDLRANNIEDRLSFYANKNTVKGFRHVLQGEVQRDLMLNADFKNGISKLEKHNFTYDLLIFNDQILYSEILVKSFANQKFVINHLAKPNVKLQEIETWKKGIKSISKCENVSCKISGMVTEADWQNWSDIDFTPYLDIVFEAFGTKRLLFGSDWPVCNVAGGYRKALNILKNYIQKLTQTEQQDIFGKNAARFYNL